MNNQKLDFIVIGAAKSGTTTLFELIKDHPDIYIPSSKEVPFFSDDAIYSKGFDWYINTYFGDTPGGKTLGTITPQYMLGQQYLTPDVIAERIYTTTPNVKLLALLRHPITRAFSHYKMSYRRGYNKKSFKDVVTDLLNSDDLEEKRRKADPATNFLFGSEYGRILQHYYDQFPANQILVLYTKDLKNKPQQVVNDVLNFLEVKESYTPPNLGKEYLQGGSKPKLKYLTPGYIYRLPYVKTLWQRFMPYKLRKKIEINLNRWNVKPDDSNLSPDDEAYKYLVDFFQQDVEKLSQITWSTPPWSDWE